MSTNRYYHVQVYYPQQGWTNVQYGSKNIETFTLDEAEEILGDMKELHPDYQYQIIPAQS